MAQAADAALVEAIHGMAAWHVPEGRGRHTQDHGGHCHICQWQAPNRQGSSGDEGRGAPSAPNTSYLSVGCSPFAALLARMLLTLSHVRSQYEWDRFMRFMERYAEANGLGFSKA
eukprot:scaffold94652_cov36-Tisochrysis_lutea.AAC.1